MCCGLHLQCSATHVDKEDILNHQMGEWDEGEFGVIRVVDELQESLDVLKTIIEG